MKVTDNRTGKSKEVPERYGKIMAKLPRYATRHLVAEAPASDAPKRRGRPPKVKPEVVTSAPPVQAAQDDTDLK